MRSLTLRGRDLVLKGRLTKWVTRIGERPRAPKDHKGLSGDAGAFSSAWRTLLKSLVADVVGVSAALSFHFNEDVVLVTGDFPTPRADIRVRFLSPVLAG